MLLSARGIVKRFAGVTALHGVDFDVYPGEIHMLLGENGAGKSTLIKILTGVFMPEEGQLDLDGRPVHIRSPLDAQRLGIWTIHQELSLIPDLSVAENLMLGREPLGKVGRIKWSDLRAQAEEALRLVHAEGIDVGVPVNSLSIAMQQRVEIARAVSARARLVIMDEPTSSLGLEDQQHLLDLVQRMASEGTAIIYITHRLEEVRQVGQRITVLRDGRLVGSHLAPECSMDHVVQMMVGREPLGTARSGFSGTAESPVVLDVKSLTRDGEFYDVSFRLHRGEVLGVFGLVGAGRSELARCLFGLSGPDRGEIAIDGLSQHWRSPVGAIKGGVALVPEDRRISGIVPLLSVRDNIELATLDRLAVSPVGFLFRQSPRTGELSQRLRVKCAGLSQPVGQLSGGNQQKIVIARWLSSGARILIFDEPTRGIDVGARAEIYQLIDQLAADGLSVLLISSELPEILAQADRILVMRQGRLSGEFLRDQANEEVLLRCALPQ